MAFQVGKKKWILSIIGIILIVAAIIGSYQFQAYREQEALKTYKENLKKFVYHEQKAGEISKQMIDEYSNVWSDFIFNNNMWVSGQVVLAASDALETQRKTFQYSGVMNDLDLQIKKANQLLKQLKNPPEEYKDEYNAALELHKSLNDLVSLAKNPSGSYENYNELSGKKKTQFTTDTTVLAAMVE